MTTSTVPRLYDQMAEWWPLMSAVADYEEEADFYGRLLREAGTAPARTLLELGSGGGNNASFLKRRFEMTLVEPAEGMLTVSRALNPDCEHVQGDMRDVRLGCEFDRVFIHDAIVYMTTPEDLARAIATAFVHCRSGGGALFAPDYIRETFRPATEHGGYDGDGRGLRFLEWVHDPNPRDCCYQVDYALLLRDGEETWVEHDQHVEGLFSRAQWLEIIEAAGFTNVRALPLEHSEVEPGVHEVFACDKP